MTRPSEPGTAEPERAEAPSPETEAKELAAFRMKVWRGRRRRVKLMGRVYLAGGLAALVAGYVTQYFGLEILAAVLIPLGAFFTLVGNESYVKSSLAGESVISAMRVLQEAMAVNSDEGHAVFIPPAGDRETVDMYIPAADAPDGALDEGQGHHYTPLGHGLFLSYLKEAGGRAEREPLRALDQLRTIMTSGLELADDIRYEVKDHVIDIAIKNATFAEIGNFPDIAQGVYARAGCPVTNSMAEWVSYCTGARIKWLGAQVNPTDRGASVKLLMLKSPE